MVMVTLTLAGIWYGWLRLWSGSIWPVSLSHNAFDDPKEGAAGAAIATSPAMIADVTTETGGNHDHQGAAGYLLIRRAADFDKADPKTPQPNTRSHIAPRPTNTDEPG